MCCVVSRAPGPVKSYLCYWIGCQDFVFDSCLTSGFAHNSKVPHSVSSRHRFTSSRFTTDDDRLVLVVSERKRKQCMNTYNEIYSTSCDYFCFYLPGHLFVGLLCHSKYMRVHVSHVLAWVGMNDCISIDMKLFVWIYSHQYNTWKWGNSTGWAESTNLQLTCSDIVWQSKLCFNSTTVCIDDSGLHKSHFKIVQDCRFMQVAEGSEVVLPHQDVRVAKRGQLWFWRVNGVVALLHSNRWCKKKQRVSS